MISKTCLFIFESAEAAQLAQSKINLHFAHVAKAEGRYLTLTAGTSDLQESMKIAVSFSGVECDSDKLQPASERDQTSRWNSPKERKQ